MMNSSNQVKQLRLQRAWSQEQLAELAGLSVRTIQRIENGDRPGLETLSALAAVFEVNVADITGDSRRATKSLSIYVSKRQKRACIRKAAFSAHCRPPWWCACCWFYLTGLPPGELLVCLGRRDLGALLLVRGLRLFVFGGWIRSWRQTRLQRLLRK
jgi:transcriptional regulator with XRE-family HTH domain